jgi:hypothetical protein
MLLLSSLTLLRECATTWNWCSHSMRHMPSTSHVCATNAFKASSECFSSNWASCSRFLWGVRWCPDVSNESWPACRSMVFCRWMFLFREYKMDHKALQTWPHIPSAIHHSYCILPLGDAQPYTSLSRQKSEELMGTELKGSRITFVSWDFTLKQTTSTLPNATSDQIYCQVYLLSLSFWLLKGPKRVALHNNWDVTPCSLVEVCQHFRGMNHLHLHGRRVR